ncbi:guanylate-binding protein 3-like [Impatiens glandulifera]|uniref:guanylate-binding protein 3-like n=1 Tax=Impatiens glandulifera TaxID=253017 RepID=UPI001FB0C531|nr:guanylate-binding protein 3-like [Impatiens glandulifera]
MRRFFSRGSDESPPHTSPEPSSPISSSSITGPPRPIRLIYCDEKGKFKIDPEAVAILQLVKEPIGVISVCGLARQGKSFILNQLLGRSSGFQVASTHRPCTKGLWLWSAPIKRTALDGTEYKLLLLDSEGIAAYDQTGTYSTQIFSLAVLLSSMFVYNQMSGIDEAALDRLSLVTEMTKHIRVRASGGQSTVSELGQFSPIFVWLLRDFYLDLVEDNRKITPRDYLELALSPLQGTGRDIGSKNEIRASIRALFPDRECFTLVRPLSNENELQRLDQIPLEKLRPEFRSGLDALTKYVFERTRPKQVGGTIMTGPIFARITESFLDALNKGAVPTITSSWQSVEEAECQRAYDLATEAYMKSFDRSKSPEEAVLREAHEEAVQKSTAIFNDSAVGSGSVRHNFEKRLQKFVKKAFEDFKKDIFREAYLQCSKEIQNMEKTLRSASRVPDAKFGLVIKVLDGLVSKYEASCNGPEKWGKLATFLKQSLEGPLLDLVNKQIDQVVSEKNSLALKYRSIEDKMVLLNKQLEASETYKSEYSKHYEEAINDKKKLAEEYTSLITNIESKSSTLEERCSSLSKSLESTRQESADWKRKYEQVLSKKKAMDDQANSEITVLKSRCSAAEARLAASREQAESAQEEAGEWKRKYDIAFKEAKAALEKAAVVQERAHKQTQEREDDLRAEWSEALTEKEEEIKDKTSKLEYAEQRLTTLNLELKAAESKIRSYDVEISNMKLEIKELNERLQSANATTQSYEREAKILEQEKIHLEEKYKSEFDRFEEVQERCRIAEREAKRTTELADIARAEAALSQKEKSEIQRIAMERLTRIERADRQVEILERRNKDLHQELERLRVAEMDAQSKVVMLEGMVDEREKEIETLVKSNNEQRTDTVQVLQTLLDAERKSQVEANNRAEALSIQLQATQGKLDLLQQKLTETRLNESALDSKLRTASHGKRSRVDDFDMGVESVQDDDMDINNGERGSVRGYKRSRSTNSPLKTTSTPQQHQPEDGGSIFKGDDDDNQSQQTSSEDYAKFTVLRLKQELTKYNFGAELLKLKNPTKKEIVSLYERFILPQK